MKKILLIGATGQLGNKVFEKLSAEGRCNIRVLVRADSNLELLKSNNPEVFTGDLTDKESIDKAVEGCDFIIATANSVAPRKKSDTFQAVDVQGYRDLIASAGKNKVEQFIYVSAAPFPTKYTHWVPLADSKAQTETYLKNSGVTYTIFQPDAFMDVYFAFMGSNVPVQNEPAHLVNRPWNFMQQFYKGVKDDVANGKIGIIGNGLAKHSFIAVDNVADFIVKAVDNPDLFNKTIPLGGPEALSGLEVKQVFEKVLNTELKVKRTPAFMMKMLGNVFSLFSTSASNIFKLNYLNAVTSTESNCLDLARKLSIHLVTAEEYLTQKLMDRQGSNDLSG